MWVKASECNPLADGFYAIKTITGRRTVMQYTREGGWNTFYTESGHLVGGDISDYVGWWKNPTIKEEKTKIYHKK